MIEIIEEKKKRHEELQKLVADPTSFQDPKRYRGLMQEYASLSDIVDLYAKYEQIVRDIQSTRELLSESGEDELKELAREEIKNLSSTADEFLARIRRLLVPPDPLDLKNIIMEIRAGTGGEEAALFVADLFRMYSHFSELKRWVLELLSSNETGIGGFKEVIFSIAGRSVYEHLKYESGVHRVQRVPVTESSGRIHTSAVTVAVLPEAEETEVEIRAEDLRVDVFRSSGPGGQSVNTTDSAVRVTHLPTSLVVTCQDEKSQHKNKAKALRVLRARLYDLEERRRHEQRARERKSQIGTGDRSERIRTYNFPQNRITDHRIGLTLYKLEAVLQGQLEQIIDALKLDARETYLNTAG